MTMRSIKARNSKKVIIGPRRCKMMSIGDQRWGSIWGKEVKI
jgi:hypothetical protein